VGKASSSLVTRTLSCLSRPSKGDRKSPSEVPDSICGEATSGKLRIDQPRRALIDVWLGCGRETQRGTVIGSAGVF